MKETEGFACPRCGNTFIEKKGDYMQCVSSNGEGKYVGNTLVLNHQSCGFLGLPEEVRTQTKL